MECQPADTEMPTRRLTQEARLDGGVRDNVLRRSVVVDPSAECRRQRAKGGIDGWGSVFPQLARRRHGTAQLSALA